MADGGLITVTLPDGGSAQVTSADLPKALAMGATTTPTAPTEEEKALGGPVGQAASAAFGAGRMATMGLTDVALPEIANLIGGEGARKDMIRGLNVAKEVNPYATMGGEAAGLSLGLLAGEGPASLGGLVEEGIAARAGVGLAGRALSMGARGAIEGAQLGATQQISEAALGDTDLAGEKLIAGTAKEALLGGALGAGLGLLTGAAGKVGSQLLKRGPGPTGNATLDTLAGAEGAGAAMRNEARAAESLVEDIRKSGATSEQAARLVDEAKDLGQARAAAGPGGGIFDQVQKLYAANRSGGNELTREALERGFSDAAKRGASYETKLNDAALKIKHSGDSVLRNVEDTLNEVQFRAKPDQFAKFVDASKVDIQRDTVAKLLQQSDDVLKFWESTAGKGGAEGAIKSLRKRWTDTLDSLYRADEAGGKTLSRDLFMKAEDFKQALDRESRHGMPMFGRPEAVTHAESGILPLADKWRSTLEDAAVWGDKAAGAQREWNGTFSAAKARRDDFGRLFGQTIDRERGIPISDLNAEKVLGQLRKFGDEASSYEASKTVGEAITGFRNRINAIEKYGELSEGQLAKLAKGKAALDEMEATFSSAKKEATIAAKLKDMRLEEQGPGLGGIPGLAMSLVTKPLTTMERLGAVKGNIDRMSSAISSGLEKYMNSAPTSAGAISKTAPKLRPRQEIIDEISKVRELAANPPAIQARAEQIVGDLGQHAPQVAAASAATMQRLVTYLAMNAPKGSAHVSAFNMNPTPRYSDQALAEYERMRAVAADPRHVIVDLNNGSLNRQSIKAVEFVYPKLYLEMQETTQKYLQALDAKGMLDEMPMAQQAQIATLLKVPPGEVWEPDFMQMMQAAKAPNAPRAPTPMPTAATVAKRPIKMDTSMFQTEAQQVESGRVEA